MSACPSEASENFLKLSIRARVLIDTFFDGLPAVLRQWNDNFHDLGFESRAKAFKFMINFSSGPLLAWVKIIAGTEAGSTLLNRLEV